MLPHGTAKISDTKGAFAAPNGICSADPAASDPAASSTGLVAMLGVLVGAAFVALRLRRE